MENKIEFRQGDKVKMRDSCSGCIKGNVYPLHSGMTNGSFRGELWAWDNSFLPNSGPGCHCQDNWELYERKEMDPHDRYYTFLKDWAGMMYPPYTNWAGVCSDKTEIIKTNKTKIMTKISNAFKKFLNPDLQTQVKAGFRNGELELTQAGKDVLLEILVNTVTKEFTDAATEIVAENEKVK